MIKHKKKHKLNNQSSKSLKPLSDLLCGSPVLGPCLRRLGGLVLVIQQLLVHVNVVVGHGESGIARELI